MPTPFADTPAARMTAFSVAELSDDALDTAVELALGHQVVFRPDYLAANGVSLKAALWEACAVVAPGAEGRAALLRLRPVPNHSTDWQTAGPAIDALRIMFQTAGPDTMTAYFASTGMAGPSAHGRTHMEAAARLRVLSTLGPTVSLPTALALFAVQAC